MPDFFLLWVSFNYESLYSFHIFQEFNIFTLFSGLNGMISALKIINVYDYLSNNNDYTNVAVMLGLAAAHRGTSNNTVYKILSLRNECILPSTCADLEISPMCRTASCMGLGLLFQGTGDRWIVEVLLKEIGKPPGPEMENHIDRESYSLTAGIALGMVTLGKANSLDSYISPDGVRILQQLHQYMNGGNKSSNVIARERQNPPSFHVLEGHFINTNVTSPGSTLALGLMYFNSNNPTITSYMEVPETQYLLEYIRPDFFYLRMISRCLVNWNKVVASKEWIMSHFPPLLKDLFETTRESLERTENFDRPNDYELLAQCFCNILAGLLFSVAMKYAGSHNIEAYQLIDFYIQKFFDSNQAKSLILTESGKYTIENTINMLLSMLLFYNLFKLN